VVTVAPSFGFGHPGEKSPGVGGKTRAGGGLFPGGNRGGLLEPGECVSRRPKQMQHFRGPNNKKRTTP